MVRLRQLFLALTVGGCALAASGQEPTAADLDRKRLDALRQEKRYLQQRINELEDALDQKPDPDATLRLSLEKAIDESVALRDRVARQQAELATVEAVRAELREAQSLNRQLEGRLELAEFRQQQQTETLNSLESAQEKLRRFQNELAARDRQIRHLQLALKGAAHEDTVIAQLEEAQRILEAQARLLGEERNAALGKIREAAAELQRMRSEARDAESARKEAESARIEAETNAREQSKRILELEGALAGTREEAEGTLAELAEERDELVRAANAMKAERDALAEQVELLKEFEAEVEESNQARIVAERRAAGAETRALRAANDLDQATAQAASLTERVSALEQECEILRNMVDPLLLLMMVGPPIPPPPPDAVPADAVPVDAPPPDAVPVDALLGEE